MISVIVPIYNVAPYLAQCLDSLQRQTYSDMQVVLVNDGSTDDSPAIAHRYVQQDKRFILVNQANGGLSAARNTGLEHAKGEYVTFVDSDDYIDDDYLATLIRHAEGYDVVQSGFRRVNDQGNILREVKPHPTYRLNSACFRLYRRTFLTENSLAFEVGQFYEDVLFSAKMWLSHPRINTIDYCGYNYRVNSSSITSLRHDTRYLFNCLRQMQHEATTLHDRWILCYTRLRLRAHFILNR